MPHKQKILIISSNTQSLISFRGNLLKKLTSAGIDVTTLSPLPTAKQEKTLNNYGISHIPIEISNVSLNPLHFLTTAKKISEITKKEEPDIIFGYALAPLLLAGLCGRFNKVKAVGMFTGLGYFFRNSAIKIAVIKFLTKPFMRICLNGLDTIIFHNEGDLTDLKEQRWFSKNMKTQVVHGSGVDKDYFAPTPLPPKTTFLFIGRLLREKGIYEYLHAAKKISKEFPEVTFLIAGGLDANPTSLSKKELHKLTQNPSIQYLGHLTDVRKAIQDCSVIVHPSYHEGLPRAVLEAMSMGRGVIASNIPGCRPLVTPDNGLLVPAQNAEALIKAIRHVCKHPETIAKWGKVSRHMIEEKFDVKIINKEMLKIILGKKA